MKRYARLFADIPERPELRLQPVVPEGKDAAKSARALDRLPEIRRALLEDLIEPTPGHARRTRH